MAKMRLALGQFNQLSDEKLLFAKQLGVDHIQLNTPALPGEAHWEFMDLLHLRTRCADAGLELVAIENVPVRFYDKAMLGLPGRDEQIAHMATTIRNMGRAGIPILGYHWMPNGVWRTSYTTPGRGGAQVTSFDMELARNAPLSHGRVYTDDDMWATYEYYIQALLPVAEEAGVRLALHPDDPPVESLGGVAHIFRNFQGFKRAMEIGDSPMHGLDFCHGCWSEMGAGEILRCHSERSEESPLAQNDRVMGVLNAIRYFGQRGKILYVHLRDVQGTVPRFQECFVEEGNSDMFEVLKTLKEVGFDGFLLPDHVPHMVDDTPWGHRARAYAIGYIKALRDVVDRLS